MNKHRKPEEIGKNKQVNLRRKSDEGNNPKLYNKFIIVKSVQESILPSGKYLTIMNSLLSM